MDEDFRAKHDEIDWKAIAGMRDRLIHHYFGVDYDIVWDAVTTKVPALHQDLASIVRDRPVGQYGPADEHTGPTRPGSNS